jgi:quinolinate synthase
MPETTQQIDIELDLFEEIERLKKELNAVLLAHYYQEPDIQDIADFVGDSLGLSQQAAKTDADTIVFAGVHFMAETAKILSPDKMVLLPDLEAGCSLADNCPPEKFEAFVKAHPDHVVISYVNCSAATKALSDIIVTSSNAEKIVRQIPLDKKIIFAPDKNLGAYISKKLNREMLLWPAECEVHVIFSEKKIVQQKVRHPEALIVAHPECEDRVLQHADHIGSTASMLRFVQESDAKEFIVATEPGIIHQMQKSCPDKTFIPAPTQKDCPCSECPYMRKNTLEKLFLCMKNRSPEITLDEDLRQRALKPILRMLEMS